MTQIIASFHPDRVLAQDGGAVKDMSISVPFYDKFLPLLEFDIKNKTSAVIEKHEFNVVEYSHPLLAFAITSPRFPSQLFDPFFLRVRLRSFASGSIRYLSAYIFRVRLV